MGLRLEFNRVLLLVLTLGLIVTGYISYDLLHRNARDELHRSAGVMIKAPLSMRSYTNTQLRPLIPYEDEKFHPQSVPAHCATEIMSSLRKEYTDYTYKEAALNRTNPRDMQWNGRPISSMPYAMRQTAVRSAARATPLPVRHYIWPGPFRSRTRPALPATPRLPRRRRPWSRFMAPIMAFAGNSMK